MFDNFALQRHIRDHQDLTLSEKAIAFILSTYRNPQTGACFPSQERLAKQINTSRKHVNHVIASLKRKKVLDSGKKRLPKIRRKTVTNYVFLFDKENGCNQ